MSKLSLRCYESPTAMLQIVPFGWMLQYTHENGSARPWSHISPMSSSRTSGNCLLPLPIKTGIFSHKIYVHLLFTVYPSEITVKLLFNRHIVPILNPDGYEYTHTCDRMWRKNRARHEGVCVGVDLNRNFR